MSLAADLTLSKATELAQGMEEAAQDVKEIQRKKLELFSRLPLNKCLNQPTIELDTPRTTVASNCFAVTSIGNRVTLKSTG